MQIVIATGNPGKVLEFERILAPLGVCAVSLKEMGVSVNVPETGETFAQNAFIKAKAVCEMLGLPAIADDSGICVDALGGAPGIYSARYATSGCDASNSNDEDNTNKLLLALQGLPKEKRSAHFSCAICCCFPGNDDILTATGRVDGWIGFAREGDGGFGYDPVFIKDGFGSFGTLSPLQKDKISHRGIALRKFSQKLQQYFSDCNGTTGK